MHEVCDSCASRLMAIAHITTCFQCYLYALEIYINIYTYMHTYFCVYINVSTRKEAKRLQTRHHDQTH